MVARSILTTTLTAALIGGWSFMTPASAQSLCEDRSEIVVKLKEIYQENHVASGLESGSKMVEIWTGTNGTWTILITRASGISCVVASGDNWLDLPAGTPALGTES